MIIKNGEEVLVCCLACVISFADEIIVVDTGSIDKMKEVAAGFTDKLYDFAWCDDFSKARNCSLSKATQDFIMWLDVDDMILQEDQEQLVELKQRLQPEVFTVMMKHHTAFDDKGNPTFFYYWERLMSRRMQHCWSGVIHEVIPLTGMAQYEDIAVTHQKLHINDPDRNLCTLEKLPAQGKQLDAREQFCYARELYYHTRYHDALQVFEAFSDGKQGQVENNIDVCEMMGHCYSALQQKDEELQAYSQSFRYGALRVGLCCDIGEYFFDEKRWKEAVFWCEIALHRTRDDKSGAFVCVDCYGYLPAIQLCARYWQLHDRQASMRHNDIAGRYRPDSIAVQQNRKFSGNVSQ